MNLVLLTKCLAGKNTDRQASRRKGNDNNDKSHKGTEDVGKTDHENELDVDPENIVTNTSTVPTAAQDLVTPADKEIEISPNLTGTAVKNSVALSEPTPQFFGSKKRLFPSFDVTVASSVEMRINTPRYSM